VRLRPIILGIDPGTTTGVTILGLNGEVLASLSKKEFKLQEITRIVSEMGKPIIIATDMQKPPKKVERLAASFSAKLFHPPHSLTRHEKQKLLKSFFKGPLPPWDRHQKDSLSAALYAWKRIRGLIKKIEEKLKDYTSRQDYDELLAWVEVRVILKNQNIEEALKSYEAGS